LRRVLPDSSPKVRTQTAPEENNERKNKNKSPGVCFYSLRSLSVLHGRSRHGQAWRQRDGVPQVFKQCWLYNIWRQAVQRTEISIGVNKKILRPNLKPKD